MIHNFLPLLGIAILFVVIAAVAKTVLKQRAKEPQSYPYEKERTFFSPAERSFLGVLEQVVNGRYRFMGKVRLADIVKAKSGMSRSAWQNAFNRIQSKRVDIVGCDPATLNVQFAIELDDSTHGQSGRQSRDRFVDNALRAAGIPIVHVAAKAGYSVQEIQDLLSEVGAVTKT
jgi:hypothetical protein